MNMFKKNGGFTLVELIVVIAILAILAAVAVPAYTGYIAKAEEAGDLQMLSAVNTAVQGLAAAEGETVLGVKVEETTAATEDDPAVYTVTVFVETTDDKGTEDATDDVKVAGASTKVTDASVKTLVDMTFRDEFKVAYWTAGDWNTFTDKDATVTGLVLGCGTHVDLAKDGTCDVCGNPAA